MLSDELPEDSQTLSDLFKQIEGRAVYLLAMREHGDLELKRKLNQKFLEPDLQSTQENPENAPKLPGLVINVLLRCQKENWQSDERYIETYVRLAIEKGQGPYKIRHTLRDRTSHQHTVDDYLALGDDDWSGLAQAVLIKKYGDAHKPSQVKEQARRMRFLQSRGFAPAHIYKAFQSSY